MRERGSRGSHWGLAILAFFAGMAVHASTAGHRPQIPVAQPRTPITTPVADVGGRVAADASSDTCSVQQD
jgi:hypothetical protein